MKTVKIAYRCDYCGEVIDQDNEAVMAVFPGRIGYQDSFVPGSDDKSSTTMITVWNMC